MANFFCRCETINSAGFATPFMLYFFAKNLPKFEKRWVKPGKNGEISGRDENLLMFELIVFNLLFVAYPYQLFLP
jgi:hypothetical protein